jgi:hypothetical protein
MNIFLWILQVLLALHTLMGAVWKFSHTAEQTMPSLKAIPGGIWLAMSVVEIICAICLLLPALNKSFGAIVPVGALIIAAEMLAFCGIHMSAGAPNGYGPMVYWLVVAALCVFTAYGRFALSPF